MSNKQVLTVIRNYLAVVAVSVAVGCASNEPPATNASGMGGQSQREAPSPEVKRKIDDFIGMTSAFIRRVGQDVKAKGYTVIFTDVGPESLERDEPDVFRELARKSSGGGVQVRGFSRAEEQDGLFRDKQTAEKGVGLWMVDVEEDGQGGRIVSGSWSEGPVQENWHEVKYLVLQKGSKWRAEPYRPPPSVATGGKPLFSGVNFFDGPDNLSGQLVFQRLDYERPNRQWKCISNVVYSLDLATKVLVQIADLGTLDARLVKVSDDGQMLCFYDINGGIYLNARFFVHSVAKGQTKQVKFPDAIEPFGVAVLGNTVFVASYSLGPLYQYDFASESLSEFLPAGLPAKSALTYPRTRFSEPGVLYFHYGPLAYYRWTQSSGDLKKLPDFSYCMTADGNHIWLGDRHGDSYPLFSSSNSQIPYRVAQESGNKVPPAMTITNFKFPGGRSCSLDQLSPCGGFALLTVEASGSTSHYIVDLKDGCNRMLLRNEYASKRQDLGTVSRVFWVKKGQ